MPKGWRIELTGPDGETRAMLVAVPDQPKALKAVLARSKSVSVKSYPLSDDDYERLALSAGEMRESPRTN